MSDIEIIFLGINQVGMEIYDWLCDRDGIEVLALLTTKNQLRLVEDLKPDYLISVGFRHIVPKDILEVPIEGCLNLHPALLPHNRGAHPNVWSIVDETPAGVTLHYMDATLDTGEIIAQKKVQVSFSDTGKDLYQRLERAQFELFTDVWPDVESNSITTRSQDQGKGNYHTSSEFESLCKINPDEEHTVKELLDVLRALTFPPYENAYLEVDGEKYFVEVEISEANEK